MEKLFLLAFVSICLLTACGEDPGPECIKADFIGSWMGTERCGGSGAPNTVVITIETKGNQLEIDGGEFETDLVSVGECQLSGDNTSLGFGYKYRGRLSGDTLILQHENVVIFQNKIFNYKLTKL